MKTNLGKNEMRLKMVAINLLIVQIFAPYEIEKDEEKKRFNKELTKLQRNMGKGKRLVVMGNFGGN